FRPQSDNVDMYQFTVNSAGTLDAETIAQRLTYDVIAMPPQSGPVGNSVVDGSTFTISDGTRTVTFEFAADGRTLTDANIAIAYRSTDTSQAVAADVARAVNAAATATGLKASAIANGDQVDLNSGLTVTNSAAQGQVTYSQQLPSGLNTVITLYGQTNVIQAPQNGGLSVVDGSTFTLNDGIHPPVTFEFARNGRTVAGNHVAINYLSNDAANTVATEIAKAINDNVANQSGLNASAAVQFNQVVLSGPLTVTPGGSQGGVTYTLARQIVARND